MAILLILALALSYLSLVPLVQAPAVVSHPGGTVVEVVQGDIFTLRFRLRWDGAAPGYFAIAVSWDSPRSDNSGTPSENFTFLHAKACFDNGDEIYTEAVFNEGPAPENENVWRYAVAVRHSEGDPRNGEFNVDVVLRAAGFGGGAPCADGEPSHPDRGLDGRARGHLLLLLSAEPLHHNKGAQGTQPDGRRNRPQRVAGPELRR
jgi:hypothetical protein